VVRNLQAEARTLANPELPLRPLKMKQTELRRSLDEVERKLKLENDKKILSEMEKVDAEIKSLHEKERAGGK
jgi:hypothetical protein